MSSSRGASGVDGWTRLLTGPVFQLTYDTKKKSARLGGSRRLRRNRVAVLSRRTQQYGGLEEDHHCHCSDRNAGIEDPAEFRESLCHSNRERQRVLVRRLGVDVDGLGGHSGFVTELLPATDGWAHYSIYGYCGSRYYRVRLVDAAAQLSRVIPLVNAKRQDGSLPEVISTCFDFRADGQFSGDDAGRLVNDVGNAQLQHLKSTAPERVIHYQRSEQLFSDHLERSKRYWLTLLFEFSWLSGVIILTALPFKNVFAFNLDEYLPFAGKYLPQLQALYGRKPFQPY